MRRAVLVVAAIVLTANTSGFASGGSHAHDAVKPPHHAQLQR